MSTMPLLPSSDVWPLPNGLAGLAVCLYAIVRGAVTRELRAGLHDFASRTSFMRVGRSRQSGRSTGLVMQRVFGAGHYLQVLGPIIETVVVLVMHKLRLIQRATEHLFHDPTMLRVPDAAARDHFVPLRVYGAVSVGHHERVARLEAGMHSPAVTYRETRASVGRFPEGDE